MPELRQKCHRSCPLTPMRKSYMGIFHKRWTRRLQLFGLTTEHNINDDGKREA